MTTDLLYFLPPALGLTLIIFAFKYNEDIAGIFGGLLLFLFGVNVFINNIASLTSLANLTLASVCFGYGGYVFIYGSIQKLQEMLNF